jgi:hypothetical protein
MASPLTVTRNDFRLRPKCSDIYTPPAVARFLFDLLNHTGAATVFDPAVGTGRLTDPWYDAGCRIIGCDIVDRKARLHRFHLGRYEETKDLERPDLVVCNPAFNGCTGRRLYPEVFLEHTFTLFGSTIPTVLFVPMGFRLNQRKKSTRWRWCRDCGAALTSIISLPLDIFLGVEFHAEILVFNVDGIRPHYFLTEEALQ